MEQMLANARQHACISTPKISHGTNCLETVQPVIFVHQFSQPPKRKPKTKQKISVMLTSQNPERHLYYINMQHAFAISTTQHPVGKKKKRI